MKRLVVLLIIVVTIITARSPLNADVIYSTFGPGETYRSDAADDIGNSQEIGVSFTPSSDVSLDFINFAAFFRNGLNNQLTVNLETDASGVPSDSVIESFNFTNLSTTATVYTATSLLHPLLLANTQYWVVLTAADLENTVRAWNWNDQGIIGHVAAKWPPDYPTWREFPHETTPALSVNASSVPEPSTILLLGAGLAGVGLLRKRFKN
jgi:PEP-CTERM motif